MKRTVVLAATLVLLPPLAWSARAQETVPLPEGDGRARVEEACSQCHDLETTFLYNGDDEKWQVLVDDMVSFGAELTPQERDQVLAYLRMAFSTDRVSGDRTTTPLPTAKGRGVMNASCASCHGPTLVARKRVDRSEWEKVLQRHTGDKRVTLSPEQRDELLKYLSANFPPPAKPSPARK